MSEGGTPVRVIRVTPISLAYPEPNDDGAVRYVTLCRIEDGDGRVGWGEAVTSWPEVCRATDAMIEGLAELVVGRDPRDNVAVWREIKQRAWWYGNHGGIASFALAAIDMALWDLKGKLLGVPVVQLLGGAHHTALPAVASTHAFDASLEREAERHGRYVAAGYRGVKIGLGKRGRTRLGHERERDLTFMRLLREAVGPEASIMLDRGVALTWDSSYAIRLVNALDEYDLRWIEEPFEPSELEAFRRLRQHTTTLVASGEREWTVEGYARFVASGVVDVVGFDPGRAEGITGGAKVIDVVEAHGAWFNAHAWSTAIGTAASLALSATTPRCVVFELKPDENPMQHELVETPFVQRNGTIGVPDGPGLGIEVLEHVVERYRMK